MEQITGTLFFFRNLDICLFHVEKLYLGDVKFCGKKQYPSFNSVIHLITNASG